MKKREQQTKVEKGDSVTEQKRRQTKLRKNTSTVKKSLAKRTSGQSLKKKQRTEQNTAGRQGSKRESSDADVAVFLRGAHGVGTPRGARGRGAVFSGVCSGGSRGSREAHV